MSTDHSHLFLAPSLSILMLVAPRPVDEVRATYMSLQGQQQPLVFERGVRLGDMQRQLCSAFAKRYPLSQVGVIVGERAFVEFLERPLLHVTDGNAIEVVFTRFTDMKHVDLCFRGQRRSFEEDMREPDAKGA